MSEPHNVGANTPQPNPVQLNSSNNYKKEDVARINIELAEVQFKLNKLITSSKSTSKQQVMSPSNSSSAEEFVILRSTDDFPKWCTHFTGLFPMNLKWYCLLEGEGVDELIQKHPIEMMNFKSTLNQMLNDYIRATVIRSKVDAVLRLLRTSDSIQDSELSAQPVMDISQLLADKIMGFANDNEIDKCIKRNNASGEWIPPMIQLQQVYKFFNRYSVVSGLQKMVALNDFIQFDPNKMRRDEASMRKFIKKSLELSYDVFHYFKELVESGEDARTQFGLDWIALHTNSAKIMSMRADLNNDELNLTSPIRLGGHLSTHQEFEIPSKLCVSWMKNGNSLLANSNSIATNNRMKKQTSNEKTDKSDNSKKKPKQSSPAAEANKNICFKCLLPKHSGPCTNNATGSEAKEMKLMRQLIASVNAIQQRTQLSDNTVRGGPHERSR